MIRLIYVVCHYYFTFPYYIHDFGDREVLLQQDSFDIQIRRHISVIAAFPLTQLWSVCVLHSRYILYPKKDITVFIYFSELRIHIVYVCTCERKRKTPLPFSQQSRIPFANSREGFKSIVAQKLARVVTLSTKNDGRCSFRLEYRDCYPTWSGQRPTSDTGATPTLFFVKRTALGRGRGFEKRKIMWALFSRTSHYFPVTSLSVLPFSHPDPSPPPSEPPVSWPCAGNDPSRTCNYHSEMARVVQLDNDNKDNNDKNNYHSNEENHGAGSDLAYCKRLPLSLSTTWKMIILLIRP